MNVRRGEVWNVKFSDDASMGEAFKMRPCVVIQNNRGNINSVTTIVVPLTSKEIRGVYPTQVRIKADFLKFDSIAQCEGMTTINQDRVQDYCG